MSKATKYIQLEQALGAHNYKPLDIVIERGEGCWVYDVDGNKYFDCLSAYSAVNQGHCHPEIVAALVEQSKKLTLTSRAFRNTELPYFYKELCELTGFTRAIAMNSGAEAVETAIKLVRKWGYTKKNIAKDKAEIIVCSNNFHGRTTTIVGFSSEAGYKANFGPFTPGFVEVPYGDASALRDAISENTAAFMFEPIQGEGGVVLPPEGYFRQAAAICKSENVLLVADEIQTGLGRTGKLFCYGHEGISPDVLIIGKALSGGVYPVSAVLSHDEVMDGFTPGTHGSTFGGNPLACAVARAALKVTTKEKLVSRSHDLGKWFLSKLKQIKSSKIKEVRGRGLLIGIELREPARKYCESLKERGILCKETHENVIRVAPPLVASQNDLAWVAKELEDVLGDS